VGSAVFNAQQHGMLSTPASSVVPPSEATAPASSTAAGGVAGGATGPASAGPGGGGVADGADVFSLQPSNARAVTSSRERTRQT